MGLVNLKKKRKLLRIFKYVICCYEKKEKNKFLCALGKHNKKDTSKEQTFRKAF